LVSKNTTVGVSSTAPVVKEASAVNPVPKPSSRLPGRAPNPSASTTSTTTSRRTMVPNRAYRQPWNEPRITGGVKAPTLAKSTIASVKAVGVKGTRNPRINDKATRNKEVTAPQPANLSAASGPPCGSGIYRRARMGSLEREKPLLFLPSRIPAPTYSPVAVARKHKSLRAKVTKATPTSAGIRSPPPERPEAPTPLWAVRGLDLISTRSPMKALEEVCRPISGTRCSSPVPPMLTRPNTPTLDRELLPRPVQKRLRFNEEVTVHTPLRYQREEAEREAERDAHRIEMETEFAKKGLVYVPRPRNSPLPKAPRVKQADGYGHLFAVTIDQVTGKEVSVTLKRTYVERYKAVRRHWEAASREGEPSPGYHNLGYGNLTYRIGMDHQFPIITADDIFIPFSNPLVSPGAWASGQFTPASCWIDVDISDVFAPAPSPQFPSSPPKIPLEKSKESYVRRAKIAAASQSQQSRTAAQKTRKALGAVKAQP
ncbi:hypothetical protein K505DRAFT_337025, partial [Melanomma pulvis-pyrius CBS 109.77]